MESRWKREAEIAFKTADELRGQKLCVEQQRDQVRSDICRINLVAMVSSLISYVSSYISSTITFHAFPGTRSARHVPQRRSNDCEVIFLRTHCDPSQHSAELSGLAGRLFSGYWSPRSYRSSVNPFLRTIFIFTLNSRNLNWGNHLRWIHFKRYLLMFLPQITHKYIHPFLISTFAFDKHVRISFRYHFQIRIHNE